MNAWIVVQTETGLKGYVFGGYLEESVENIDFIRALAETPLNTTDTAIITLQGKVIFLTPDIRSVPVNSDSYMSIFEGKMP